MLYYYNTDNDYDRTRNESVVGRVLEQNPGSVTSVKKVAWSTLNVSALFVPFVMSHFVLSRQTSKRVETKYRA